MWKRRGRGGRDVGDAGDGPNAELNVEADKAEEDVERFEDVDAGDVLNAELRRRERLERAVRHHNEVHRALSKFIIQEQAHAMEASERTNFVLHYVCYVFVFLIAGTIAVVSTNSRADAGATLEDGAYLSWATMTTIGYGDMVPIRDPQLDHSAGIHLLHHRPHIAPRRRCNRVHGLDSDRARNMFDQRRKREDSPAKTHARGNSDHHLDMTKSEIHLLVRSLDWLRNFGPLIVAAIFIHTVSLIFTTLEGWKADDCRRFAWMTMTTVGWGFGSFYDASPPANVSSLATDELRAMSPARALQSNLSPLCPQKTTTGVCKYSFASASCLCTLTYNSRKLLLIFSATGLVISVNCRGSLRQSSGRITYAAAAATQPNFRHLAEGHGFNSASSLHSSFCQYPEHWTPAGEK